MKPFEVDVTADPYLAKGDGKAIDTVAIKNAISGTPEKRPTVIRFPPGNYRITEPLPALRQQTLLGAIAPGWGADDPAMPILKFELDHAPCITIERGAVHGLRLECNPSATGIKVIGKPDDQFAEGVRITGCRIEGALEGIAFECKDCGRCVIDSCFLLKIKNKGVTIGTRGSYGGDCCYVSKVHVWVDKPGENPRTDVGFEFGHIDGLFISECFAFHCEDGFVFLEQLPQGLRYGTQAKMSMCHADSCTTGIRVIGYHEISIAGGKFWADNKGIVIAPEGASGGSIVFAAAAEFKANGDCAVDTNGGKLVSFSGCWLRRQDPANNNPAVIIRNGSQVNLVGCIVAIPHAAPEGVVKANHVPVDMSGLQIFREDD